MHVAATEFEAFVHVTVAALVTAVQVSQAVPFFQNPALHEAQMAASLVQAVPVASVPSVQVHVLVEVQTSASAVESLVYPFAHAVTREVVADEHARVAPASAPAPTSQA